MFVADRLHMIEVREIGVFSVWLSGLRDTRAKRKSRVGSAAWRWEIPVT
jgi:putative component of toxin-antitoxin plasmid stabilization module